MRGGEHGGEAVAEEEESGYSFGSFAIGTAFGFMFWGPTMAMFVYFKYYSRRTVSTPKSYAAVVPSQAEVV